MVALSAVEMRFKLSFVKFCVRFDSELSAMLITLPLSPPEPGEPRRKHGEEKSNPPSVTRWGFTPYFMDRIKAGFPVCFLRPLVEGLTTLLVSASSLQPS
jgi:hypothetical protein